MPLKIAILASGRGSNAQAIHQAIQTGQLDAQIQCIVCNKAGAPVLDLGVAMGLPTFCIPHKGLSREAHEAQVLDCLQAFEIDYIVLAGYMGLMTPFFLNAFAAPEHYRVVNIHPSLLPAFPGADAYRDAFEQGVQTAGITIHLVDEEMDHGPILLQESFPRYEDDTFETFQARGLALEHQLYPKALQDLAKGQLIFTGAQTAS